MSSVAKIGHGIVLLGSLMVGASLLCPMIVSKPKGEVYMGYDQVSLIVALSLALPVAILGLLAKPKSPKRWVGVWAEWLALGSALFSVYWLFLRESAVESLIEYQWGRYVVLGAAALLALGAVLATLPRPDVPSAEEQAEALLDGRG